MTYKTSLSLLFWIPRILMIIFILFLGIFALDVFIPGESFSYYSLALFMHLIPNLVLLILLIFSWKYERVGGTLIFLIGIFFTVYFKTYEFIINFFAISFPLFLIGSLFILHDYYAKKG